VREIRSCHAILAAAASRRRHRQPAGELNKRARPSTRGGSRALGELRFGRSNCSCGATTIASTPAAAAVVLSMGSFMSDEATASPSRAFVKKSLPTLPGILRNVNRRRHFHGATIRYIETFQVTGERIFGYSPPRCSGDAWNFLSAGHNGLAAPPTQLASRWL